MPCPDVIAAELRARQRRQQAARRRGLEARAAKAPLFAEQIIARELAERPDYYRAEPTDHDRGIVAARLAAREGAAVRIEDYLPANPAWDRSRLDMSFRLLAYRGAAEQLLAPLDVLRIACALAHCRDRHACFRADASAYPADHWHQGLVAAGHRRVAWECIAATSQEPAQIMEQYRILFERSAAPAAPEQLEMAL